MPDKPAFPAKEIGESSLSTMEAAPVDNVAEAAGTAQNAAEAVASHGMLDIFLNADFVVQSVIVMLIVASVICWTIIINKFLRYQHLKKRMRTFEDDIWSGVALEKYYERVRLHVDHPLASVFVAGMREWMEGVEKKITGQRTKEAAGSLSFVSEGRSLREQKQVLKDRILHAMEIARNREVKALESHLPFLATVGSAAPFIGLFGTVWGIMNSFSAIEKMKSASLVTVAPGIAEALFATAIGLFAAIPAVVFYNYFTSHAVNYTSRLDAFSDEFAAVVSRELDE